MDRESKKLLYGWRREIRGNFPRFYWSQINRTCRHDVAQELEKSIKKIRDSLNQIELYCIINSRDLGDLCLRNTEMGYTVMARFRELQLWEKSYREQLWRSGYAREVVLKKNKIPKISKLNWPANIDGRSSKTK